MASSLLSNHSGGGTSVADNSSFWYVTHSVHNSSTVRDNDLPVRCAGTVDDLKTYVSANTTLVNSTFTIVLNGSDSALLTTYTSGQTGEKSDTTHSFSVSVADQVALRVTVENDTSGVKSITWHSAAIALNATNLDETQSFFGAGSGQTNFSTASSTTYFCGGNTSNGSTTERSTRVLDSLVLSRLTTTVKSNTRTTTCTSRTRVNGGNGNQSVDFTSGQTGVKDDSSNTDSLVSGDDVAVSITLGSGTGTTQIVSCFAPAISALTRFVCNTGNAAGAGVASAGAYTGVASGPSTNTTELKGQTRIGFPASFTNFTVNVSANTASGSSTAGVRLESADTALLCTYTTGQTGLKTDTDTFAAADDDRLGYKVSRGGTGTITVTSLAFVGYTTTFTSATGIASTLAVGTAKATGAFGTSGIASTLALGTAEITAATGPTNLGPASGIASTLAVGTPGLAVSFSGAGIASTLAFVASVLAASFGASGVASTLALGTAKLTGSASMSGRASTVAFGTAKLTASFGVSGIASTVALGTAKGSGSVYASGIASTLAFGTGKATGAFGLSGIASGLAVGTPELTLSGLTVAGIASTTAFGTAKATGAAYASGVASTAALGTAKATGSASVSGVASTVALGTAKLQGAFGAGGIAGGAVGTPGEAGAVYASGIASTLAAGTAKVTATFGVDGIASTMAFGTAKLQASFGASGIASTLALGTATEAGAFGASGIAPTLGVGTPALQASFGVSGIAGAALGEPVASCAFGAAGIAGGTVGGAALVELKLASGIASTVAFGTPSLQATYRISGTRLPASSPLVVLRAQLPPPIPARSPRVILRARR